MVDSEPGRIALANQVAGI